MGNELEGTWWQIVLAACVGTWAGAGLLGGDCLSRSWGHHWAGGLATLGLGVPMAPEVPMALKLLVRLAVGSGGAMRGCSPRLIPTTSLGLELPSPVPPWGDLVLNCRPGRAGCLHASHPMAVTGAGVRPSISHRAADRYMGTPAQYHQPWELLPAWWGCDSWFLAV